MSALINEQNPQYDSLEPSRRKTTVTETGFIKSKGDILLLNLKNRKFRLSVWILAYFIFAIAELTANSIMHRATDDSNLKSAFSLLIASNIFLFIACILAWFPMHGGLEATGFLYINHLKYTSGFLFILCAILHWPAVYQLSRYGFCTSAGTISTANSYCRSYVFAYHWMGHFFAICIGLDIFDLKSEIFDNKRLRMLIYAFNLFFMFIILGSDVNYFYKQLGDLNDVETDIQHSVESGYFIVSLCCAFIVIFIGISYCDLFETFNILNNTAFRSVLVVCLLIGTGLIFFIIEVSSWPIAPQFLAGNPTCNLVLSFIPILMIIYDLQTYDS